VQTKFYWSWAGGPVLIVRTAQQFLLISEIGSGIKQKVCIRFLINLIL